MNIFGVGLPEMGLIMIVALLVFGPKKLPEISRSLGGAIRDLQKASKQFEEEFKKEAEAVEKSVVEPMKATLEKPKAISAGEGTSASKQADEAQSEVPEAEIIEVADGEKGDVSAEETATAADKQTA